MQTAGAVVIGGDYRGLGVVRSLGRRGVPVWVLRTDDILAGCSRYARRHLDWPSGTDAEQTDFLVQLADAHGLHGWTLFPTSDDTAKLVSCQHDRLRTHFRLTTSPWERYRHAADKRLVYARAAALGIRHPRTAYPKCPAELERLKLDFPVILKPAMRDMHNPFTDAKAWRVDNRAELLTRYAEACALVGSDLVMVQEVIPGNGVTQLSYACVCHDGVPLAWVTARRTRQYPADFGRASTFVETTDDCDVAATAERLIADLALTGPVEVEFKRHPGDGQLRLLDVNPRVWGWHSVGRAAGVDFAYLAYQLANGVACSGGQGAAGVRWVRLSTDLPTSLREIVRHRLRVRDFVSSLRPPLEGPLSAFDDPLPALLEWPLLCRLAFKHYRRGALI